MYSICLAYKGQSSSDIPLVLCCHILSRMIYWLYLLVFCFIVEGLVYFCLLCCCYFPPFLVVSPLGLELVTISSNLPCSLIALAMPVALWSDIYMKCSLIVSMCLVSAVSRIDFAV